MAIANALHTIKKKSEEKINKKKRGYFAQARFSFTSGSVYT